MPRPLPVTTTFELPGHRILECRGVVRGIVVRSPTLLQGFLGEQAYEEMVDHARQLGANAIVGMRYDGSTVETGSSGATEVLCYGTAVLVEPLLAGGPPV